MALQLLSTALRSCQSWKYRDRTTFNRQSFSCTSKTSEVSHMNPDKTADQMVITTSCMALKLSLPVNIGES